MTSSSEPAGDRPTGGSGYAKLELRIWLYQQRARLQAKSKLAGALRYSLSRWDVLTRYAHDGRLEIDDHAAERAFLGVAVECKNYLFADYDTGGERAAVIYTLIESGKLGGLNPHDWLADVLARIADHPARRISELLPRNWSAA